MFHYLISWRRRQVADTEVGEVGGAVAQVRRQVEVKVHYCKNFHSEIQVVNAWACMLIYKNAWLPVFTWKV